MVPPLVAPFIRNVEKVLCRDRLCEAVERISAPVGFLNFRLPLGDAAPSIAKDHVTFGRTTMAKASPCPGTFGPHSPWRHRGGISPDL
jgi:hypothetical protein